MNVFGLPQLILVGAAAVFLAQGRCAEAADASPWRSDLHSQVRLIAGGSAATAAGAPLRAGIEIKLSPGWKTYWRYPGDSGVPPRFDFSGSENLSDVTVLWPAPQRFRDAGGESIGYKDRVVFPLVLVPREAEKPVTLRLKLDYGVCEKLCVPADAKVELVLTRSPSGQDNAIAAADSAVPKPVAIGEGAFAVRTVKYERQSGRVVIDVIAPSDATVDLVAEGPNPDWALPLPQPVSGAPAGVHRFVFKLDGLPPGVKPDGAVVRLTATAGLRAIETTTRLD